MCLRLPLILIWAFHLPAFLSQHTPMNLLLPRPCLTAQRMPCLTSALMSELDRFALCKLVRPGHDHHNLDAAFSEVLG